MIKSPLEIPNFRNLWLGQLFLSFGQQALFIALTWLVLQETDSGLAVGIVLMAGGIPMALFSLVGGAITDRFSPRQVANIANFATTFLTGIFVLLIWLDAMEIPVLIVICIFTGIANAFAYPAINSMRVINKSRLSQAIVLNQGAENITDILAPIAATWAIAQFGLSTTFIFCTIFLGIGSIFIRQIKQRSLIPIVPIKSESEISNSIRSGLLYAWNNHALRISLVLIAILNFATLGPLIIGSAKMALIRFNGDVSTFGNLQAAFGIGSLIGIIMTYRRTSIKNPGRSLINLTYILGIGLITLAYTQSIRLAYIILTFMGLGNGIVSILAVSWLQQQVVFL